MLKFSFYKGPITNTVPFLDYSVKTAIETIKSDKYKNDIERLRAATDKSIRNVIKKNLDYFSFSGRFKKRLADQLIKHSGIICLDFDDMESEKLDTVKAQLKETKEVLAVFVSPSGNGLKVLVKVPGKDHLAEFNSAAQFFIENFDLDKYFDTSGKDVNRACFVSYDPDAYLNEKSLIWKVPKDFTKVEKPKKGKANNTAAKDESKPASLTPSEKFSLKNNMERVDMVVMQAERNQIDLTGEYDDWQLIAFSLASLGEEARRYFHRVSALYSEYDFQQAEDKFSDALQNGRFKTPAKFFTLARDYGLNTKKVVTIDEAKEIQELKDQVGTEENARDVHTYGFWESNGVYMSINLKGKHVAISNFTMRILFHVATSNEEAYRMIIIRNIHGYETDININTDDFVSAGSFKKVIARKGNFLWMGADYDLIRLQEKLQRDEKPTMLINTLGYNKRGNFYAFANGIYDAGINEFLKADEYGIVVHQYKEKPQNYFIPAMSKIFADKDDMFSNDKKFKLIESDITFKEWAELFEKVFGNNGRVGLIFYVSALFSDIIFKAIGHRFPMLYAYGKRGSGKGTMIQSLMKLFGEGQDQIMLGGATTVVGFMRKLAQYSNALVWMDEYKNNLHSKVIESLKNIFDRIGYERGKKDNTFQTESTPIRSAAIFSGQEMPTIEPALFSRVMQLCFSETKRTEDARNLYRRLLAMEAKGLSHLTVSLLRFRPLFTEKFEEIYEKALREFSIAINNNEVDERMIGNYSVLIATMELICKELELPFTLDEFKAQCKQLLMEQFHVLKGSDDASKFWQIVEQLAGSGEIQEDKHYQLRNGFIDIRIQDIYQKYAETMQKRRDPNILDKSTLDSYLMSDAKSFIKRHKPFFGGSQKWCLQFKYIELSIDLIKNENKELLDLKYKEMGLDVETNEDDLNTDFPKPTNESEEFPFGKPKEVDQAELEFPLKKW